MCVCARVRVLYDLNMYDFKASYPIAPLIVQKIKTVIHELTIMRNQVQITYYLFFTLRQKQASIEI